VWLVKTEPDIGIKENASSLSVSEQTTATILNGPLVIPEGKKCRVLDITGRVVEPTKITRGIYFIEVNNKVVKKVIKIR
jgi:hypothetical protein